MSAKRSKIVAPVRLTRAPNGYTAWIADVKARVRAADLRASLEVNQELIALYWGMDPYRFDFLSLGAEAGEHALEDGLLGHISKFLLELGAGFAHVGRQVPIEVDGREFFLDLLVYHLHLRCFVVLELKAGEFQPERAGKLNFYLSAVDTRLRREHDAPSIGLSLVKTRSCAFAEYALRDTAKPMGIAEYQLGRVLPKKLEVSLPSIAQIEAELAEPKAISTTANEKTRAMRMPR